MCNSSLIESAGCLCAGSILLSSLIACVQLDYYWLSHLLVCKRPFIEVFSCLCAICDLLIHFFAYVQKGDYWLFPLLMCNYGVVEFLSCLCAELLLVEVYICLSAYDLLLIFACLCADPILLKLLIAYVQLHGYWGIILLVCRSEIIEVSFCWCAIRFLLNNTLCFCAGLPLLSRSLAYVHVHYYWNS